MLHKGFRMFYNDRSFWGAFSGVSHGGVTSKEHT